MPRHLHIVALLLLASCGGQNGGPSGPVKDAGLPAPDSSDCFDPEPSGTTHLCVLCSDHDWHCGATVFPQCPANAAVDGPCSPDTDCFRCDTDGGGLALGCRMLTNTWFNAGGPLTCSP